MLHDGIPGLGISCRGRDLLEIMKGNSDNKNQEETEDLCIRENQVGQITNGLGVVYPKMIPYTER